MGYEYALVHVYYTIPPAVILSLLYRPLCTNIDVYKIAFLVLIAVCSTTPWDSYLIRNRVWTYPSNAIIGPTLFQIPAEEVFFFVIQTYNTSLIYLILSKPILHSVYLSGAEEDSRLRWWRCLGQVILLGTICMGAIMVLSRGKGFYMGLILVWAVPFILMLWSLAYQFIIRLPLTTTLLPIAIPTLYLWLVDTLALKRGTWVIESGTKLGWHLWVGLDIEEAFFFVVTNILIIFGLVAFDNALAILYTFPSLFPVSPGPLPSPVFLVKALLSPTSTYDDQRIEGLRQALDRLRNKSRSFYLASGVFQGRLRIDLTLLYSFCRVADDLVDDAETPEEARHWIAKIKKYLDMVYGPDSSKTGSRRKFITSEFPPYAHTALLLLPTTHLSSSPLFDLLKGFEIDLNFCSALGSFPISDEMTMQVYASRVAGTVAEACLQLLYYHTPSAASQSQRPRVMLAGAQMGIALQYVNIARDIAVDAKIRRVYLPTTWLKEMKLAPEDIIQQPDRPEVEALKQRLLNKAFNIYDEAKGAIEELPLQDRPSMRVCVESYMEIGRVLRVAGYQMKSGRATVPRLRRLRVAWQALCT